MSASGPSGLTPLRTTAGGPLFEDLDRVRRQLLETFGAPAMATGRWTTAPGDLEERDDAYVVAVELPGFDREDVRIEVEGRRLRVHAERAEAEREGVVRRSTRSQRHLHHEIVLPSEVEADAIEATLERGVLTIRLPKTEASQRRRIEIS